MPLGGRSLNPVQLLPAGEACELKVSEINGIQQHKLVKFHVGPDLMVFNAND